MRDALVSVPVPGQSTGRSERDLGCDAVHLEEARHDVEHARACAVGDVRFQLRAVVDQVLAAGSKSGYNFVGGRVAKTAVAPATFFFAANPSVATGVTQTGARRFGIATDGVIMADATAANLAVAFTAATEALATPLSN